MHSLTNRPMSLFRVEFDELVARHLCRHAQAGINVVHLLALLVLWYSLYSLLHVLTGEAWVLAVPALAYLAPVAFNVPLRVLAGTTLFMVLICAGAMFVPAPWWACPILIPVSYKLQALSHKFYTLETDMTEFNKKYTKGSATLFVVLLLYEVPIIMQFFLSSRQIPTGIISHSDRATTPTRMPAPLPQSPRA